MSEKEVIEMIMLTMSLRLFKTTYSLPNKVLDFGTDVRRHGVAAPDDSLGDLLLCVLFAFHREGRGAGQQLVG